VLLPILLMARLIGKKTVETKSVAIGSTDDQVAVQFGSQVPFGPMLAFAGLIYFLGFDRYVDAYFADFTLSFFSR